MVWKRLLLLSLVAAVSLIIAFDLLARFDAPPALPIVQADYPRCITINPGPLRPPRRPDARHIPPDIV